MPSLGFLRKLLVLGERQALQDFAVYPDIAAKATDIVIQQLAAAEEKQEAYTEQIREIEKEGDTYTQAFKTEITQGAVNSSLLGHLLSLVETCDDMLDKTLYLSRELLRMSHYLSKDALGSDYLKTSVYGRFATMLEFNKKALASLKNMLMGSSQDQSGNQRSLIQKYEEEVDDLKDDIIDQNYRDADRLHYVVFTHINNMVHRVDDLLDDCEDASDLVITVSNSVNK